MTDNTSPAEKAVGQPYGRVFTIRKGLLRTLEQTILRVQDDDQMDKIPAFAYDGTDQTKVKVQITVFRSEGA